MANLNTDIFHERLADCIREMADQGIITDQESRTITDDLEYIISRNMSIEEKEVTPQQLDWHLGGDAIERGEDDLEGTMYDRNDALSWR